MSNPFLKASNNRFRFLDMDPEPAPPKPVSNRVNTVKDLSENTFLKPRHNNNNNYSEQRYRPRRHKEEPPKPAAAPQFNMTEEMFPNLATNQPTNEVTCKQNYKEVISTRLEKEEEKNKVPSGWVEIVQVKGVCHYKYGAKTRYQLKCEAREELESTPHYIMNKAITSILKNRDNYIDQYDSIHGEGAYEERFVLPPVYGPEYDTEDEEPTDDSEGDDDWDN
jgi:hypothetical protein